MSGYKKILVAVDLSDESALVLDKALAIAKQDAAEVSLMHVMEPIVIGYAVELMSVDVAGLQAEASKHARNALVTMAVNVGIPGHRVHAVLGQPAYEIRAMAKQLDVGLVVIGGHGKHGFELLLGSTSSGVTHGVSCDLLIVRIPGK